MSSIEQHISNLTEAVTNLTDTVNDKIAEIDARVEAAEAQVSDFIADAASDIPQLNLIPNDGRFAVPNSLYNVSCGDFVEDTVFFSLSNGATVASAGKFEFDNATFGGSGAALSQTVIDLINATGRIGQNTQFGTEFHVAEFTQGTGTNFPAFDGSYYLITSGLRSVLGANQVTTMAYWIRAIDEDVGIRNVEIKDGQPIGNDMFISPSDGWTHIIVHSGQTRGYIPTDLNLYLRHNTRVQIAMPAYIPGRHIFPPHTAPIVSIPNL